MQRAVTGHSQRIDEITASTEVDDLRVAVAALAAGRNLALIAGGQDAMSIAAMQQMYGMVDAMQALKDQVAALQREVVALQHRRRLPPSITQHRI